MSVIKTSFNKRPIEVYYEIDDRKQLWFLAEPFAHILKHDDPDRAVMSIVCDHNRCQFDQIADGSVDRLDADGVINRNSLFVSGDGLIELINGTKSSQVVDELREYVELQLLPFMYYRPEFLD
ncbi:bro-a [Leucania separata nucleopolyhedrovirus]|uniref:Bro-a n=1 Tax=Leucania separata nucleopolyhedrovirus TaxID=1307956 RepID=Q0IL72_NPVLS|nr:bro-a [Leucania separata nucleopolyhedrovirus]AAR28811.1 bro-a [Leucania separata nucleopolyhedrovirus]